MTAENEKEQKKQELMYDEQQLAQKKANERYVAYAKVVAEIRKKKKEGE